MKTQLTLEEVEVLTMYYRRCYVQARKQHQEFADKFRDTLEMPLETVCEIAKLNDRVNHISERVSFLEKMCEDII